MKKLYGTEKEIMWDIVEKNLREIYTKFQGGEYTKWYYLKHVT